MDSNYATSLTADTATKICMPGRGDISPLPQPIKAGTYMHIQRPQRNARLR